MDNHGNMLVVPTTHMRTKGGWPSVGERWIIDRSLGYFTFAAILDQPGPVSIAAPPPETEPWLVQMYDALVSLNLIAEADDPGEDATNPDDEGDDLLEDDDPEAASLDDDDD